MSSLRSEFPQTSIQVDGRPLIYLDSAATSLKPRSVIEKMRQHMESGVANVHRGAHALGDAVTDEFERVRSQIAAFIGAASVNEIIFTSGTTQGLNLLSHSLARPLLAEGDEILLSQMEHHSNIVPWQLVAQEKRAVVRFAPVQDDGSLDMAALTKMLNPRTKVVSLVYLSNALGVWNDVKAVIQQAHRFGARVVLDAAQAISATSINVQELDCDFLVFSGHKIFGPSGVGVLYGKEALLAAMPPFLAGGSMIAEVKEDRTTFLEPPYRFEAGTPPIAEVLALGEALRFFAQLDLDALKRADHKLVSMTTEEINKLDGFRVFAEHLDRSHIVSFELSGAHPSDVGAILNEQGIAVRAGHHCCQPLMARLKIPGTVRASFSVYSNEEDVACLIRGLREAKRLLQ